MSLTSTTRRSGGTRLSESLRVAIDAAPRERSVFTLPPTGGCTGLGKKGSDMSHLARMIAAGVVCALAPFLIGGDKPVCPTCDGLGKLVCETCGGDYKQIAQVVRCPAKGGCDGAGYIKCGVCHGAGTTRCKKCNGDGKIVTRKRLGAPGNWRDVVESHRCQECSGEGKIDCATCATVYQCPGCKRCSTRAYEACQKCAATPSLPLLGYSQPLDGRVKCKKCEGKGEYFHKGRCPHCIEGRTRCPTCKPERKP